MLTDGRKTTGASVAGRETQGASLLTLTGASVTGWRSGLMTQYYVLHRPAVQRA